MKTLTILSTLILSLSTLYSSDFEVEIDGKRYLFTEGMQQHVPLRDGGRVPITISASKDKFFSQSGFSFRYPTEMKLSEESGFGARVIQLETPDSGLLMILVYPDKSNTPAEAKKELVDSLREQYKSMGVGYSEKSLGASQRRIGNENMIGHRLTFSIGGIPHEAEIYSFDNNGKTLVWCFQVATEDKDSVDPLFRKVAESFN